MSFYSGDNQGSGLWQSFADPFKSAAKTIKNVYQDLSATYNRITGDAQQPPQRDPYRGNLSAIPNYYQVSGDDTSMSQVATNLGVPVSQLVEANNGAKTLPPKGSYIRTRFDEEIPGYAGPTSPGARFDNEIVSRSLFGPSNADRGDPAAQNLRNQAYTIAQQMANGQMPDSVPSAVVGYLRDGQGKPLTLQDFYADGYTMNASGVLVRGPSTDPKNTDYTRTQAYLVNQNTPFLQQLRWNPKKKKYEKIGDLIRRGQLDIRTGKFNPSGRSKLMGRGAAPSQPVAPERTTTETPTTVLDIHLGSG